MSIAINVKARAKRARQLERYRQWKLTGVTDCFQHFEIWAGYPPKKIGAPCKVRRVGRQLANSAANALAHGRKGLQLTLDKGAQLFVIERFAPDKQAQIELIRTLLHGYTKRDASGS